MRTWFAARNRREQLLVTAFAFMLALAWAFSAVGRVRARLDAWRSARAEHTAQQLWLDRQAEIESRSASAVSNLDAARTYDATRLVATVSTLANGAGLSPAVDPPVTQRTSQFAYHTARVTFRRAALPALLNFYDEVNKQAPYLNLERVAVQTDRGAAGALNVTLEISATQIIRQ